MAKTRMFVSFDYDNDLVLKEFIVEQTRRSDSPFEVTDSSLKESAPQRDWENRARSRIKNSDIVIVMVGPRTNRASGVLKEVKMAREEQVKIVQVIGYKDASPTRVADAGQLYRWNWENLKKLLT